jgi:hypothetical protein
MAMREGAFERAMKLAVISGLKCMMGPALVSAAQCRPETRALAAAAMGEMLLDKVPYLPNRSSLPLLLPRAVAGYWVTQRIMEDEGVDDPLAAPIGAVVAAGTATFAPIIRRALSRLLSIPDPLLGLAEDYLALRLGASAMGLSTNDLKEIATDTLEEAKDRLMPYVQDAKEAITAG